MHACARVGKIFSSYNQNMRTEEFFKLVRLKIEIKSLKYKKLERLSFERLSKVVPKKLKVN